MRKTIIRIVAILLIFILLISYFYYDSFYRAPFRYRVRYESITSEKIDKKINGLSICVFSDLHYGKYMNQERTQKVIDLINEQEADVVIFLGDLVDELDTNSFSEEKQSELSSLLDSINAKYGKFAIYGNHDHGSNMTENIFQSILENGHFELINNQTIQLSKKNQESINLIALDSNANGVFAPDAAFSMVDNDNYSIVLCHTPDTFDDILNYSFDYMISGHTHGGQVYLPIYGPLYTNSYGKKYIHGKYQIAERILDVTNGVGTTKKDVRLFAEQEIVLYHFYTK